MPVVKKKLGIVIKQELELNPEFLWVCSIIDQRMKVGIVTSNKRSIKTPKEIIIVNREGKIVYLCLLKPFGVDSLRIKVAINRSKVRALHRLIILWLAGHGISIYADYELSPSGAKVWRTLLEEGIAITSQDSNIWKDKKATIRVPKQQPARTLFYGVPHG